LSQSLTRINRIKSYAISLLMNTTSQEGTMTLLTTQATLLEHYAETRRRLGDNPTPTQPIIPRDRITAREPDQEPEPVKPVKPARPTVAAGIAIVRIPPRQSTRIIQETAEKYGLKVTDLTGQSRKPRLVAARQEACYLLRLAGYSFPQIGRFLGDRDHTTIVHGERKHKERWKIK